ncbi:hypothetical protein SDC9_178792 [bioreactor metagenome]|uniref:Uncharacterized protein n=1 Tax=bioreactor metagenome TaxID=1076179 RepID=A0A645GX63_9ZZZZ
MADDLGDLGHNGAHKLIIPSFQRLAHEGMVCIAESLPDDVKGHIEIHSFPH